MERPVLVKISRVKEEAEGIRTIFVKHRLQPLPGQFLMVWIPRMDEKPFAVSYLDKDEFGMTICSVGPFSKKISSLVPGDSLGIRGPYGKGFSLGESKNIVIVAGGCGAASLALFAEEAVRKKINVKVILGARSKNLLLFSDRLKKLVGSENLILTTDDGSAGSKGFVTSALSQLLVKQRVDKVFACGPERMLKAVVDLGLKTKVKGEISMERYMKCGFGLCGHCCVDPIGIRLCVEGPVIDFSTASKIKELGSYHRVKSSRKELFK